MRSLHNTQGNRRRQKEEAETFSASCKDSFVDIRPMLKIFVNECRIFFVQTL